jgi:hypothetical protein
MAEPSTFDSASTEAEVDATFFSAWNEALQRFNNEAASLQEQRRARLAQLNRYFSFQREVTAYISYAVYAVYVLACLRLIIFCHFMLACCIAFYLAPTD